MGKVIMFANQKGGVGKTSSCIEIGYILMQQGNRVLLIDLDAQCNLTDSLGIEHEADGRDTVFDCVMENRTFKECVKPCREKLDVLPGSRMMLSQYFVGNGDIRRLKKAVEKIQEEGSYDYILIDVGPEGGNLMTMALMASDYVIAVATPAKLAYSGIIQMIADIKEGQENYKGFDVKPLGILINAGRKTNVGFLNRERYAELTEFFAAPFTTEIKNSCVMDECKEFGVPLSEYRPGNIIVSEYEDIVSEIRDRIGA